ncbi:MAG: hypothetical protein H6621_08545 [Halobacteriovoraceae bacterium]|nr:hypothetical protein [Halobacteriovoraceae bacterium]MCB9095101.1 hypothetical protein [Halobacteriovoraceae bacterium]
MKRLWAFLFFCAIFGRSFAFDQRDFEEIFLDEKSILEKDKQQSNKFTAKSGDYFIDLDKDAVNEKINFQYTDGHLYSFIYKSGSELVLKFKHPCRGGDANIERILFKEMNKQRGVLIFVINEGKLETSEKIQTMRIDIITIDRREMDQSFITYGPNLSTEKTNWMGNELGKKADIQFKELNNIEPFEIFLKDSTRSLVLHFDEKNKTWR